MTGSNQIKSTWSWQQKLKRAVVVFREEGIKSFWFKLLSEIGCYRRLLLLERSLEEPIPEIKPHFPVTIDLLKKTELDEYVLFSFKNYFIPDNHDVSRIIHSLSAGDLCFVARHERELISFSWVTTHPTRASYSYMASEIPLMPGEIYVYDPFTRTDFRGLAVSPAIRAEMIRYFRSIGYRRMILGTLPENNLNLRAVRKVGFQPFGLIGYIKIGTWRWNFYRTNKL